MFSQLAKRSAKVLPADLCTDYVHYVKNHRLTVRNKNMAVEGGTVSPLHYILVIRKFIDFMSLFRHSVWVSFSVKHFWFPLPFRVLLLKFCNYPLTTTLGDRFASCENIVSRSQTWSLQGRGMHCQAVRVKGGMSVRNGMWHGLRKDIIMLNLIYGKWCKEIN